MHADGVQTQDGYKEGDMVGRKYYMWSLYVSTLLHAHRKDECDVKESVVEMVS